MSRKDTSARDREIAAALQAGRSPADVMAAHNLRSRSSIYRAARRAESFTATSPAAQSAQSSIAQAGGMGGPAFGPVKLTSGMLYDELARTGLRRFYGRVDDDYDRVMRTINKRVNLFREMGDDPVVAAVLNAIKLTLRRVRWKVSPVSDLPADVEAAEFLESAVHDMAQSWSDTIDQALGMIQYGFSVAELVYKKRRGQDADPHSTYADGRIGWRRWTFLAPESLAPGNEWVFDDYGGIQAVNQLPPPDYRYITLPIEKAVLFRTSSEKNNPEGRALCRAMYNPWYYKKNLEEIEAISAERLGTGFPVIYAGSDVAKGGTAGDDLDVLKSIAVNVRADEQMGVVLPWAKMGGGAREGEGVLFELVAPPGKGNVDFNQVITRYEQRMAMVGLGQFIMLGMSQVGTQALATSDIDFFTLAVSAWADSIEDTIHRYATERLFRVNFFPDITAVPRLSHETVGRMSIAAFADALNKLAGGQLLTPGPELEDFIRQYADLPERPAELEETEQTPAPQSSDEIGDTEEPTTGTVAGAVTAENADNPDDVLPEPEENEMPKERRPELPAEALAELRRALAMVFSAPAQAPGVVIQSATLPLPEQFSFPAQPAPVINVTVPMESVGAALEKLAERVAQPPQIVVNVPEQPAPIVNFSAPAQPAPVVNVAAPAAPIVRATVEMPEMEESGEITDAKGNTKKYTKRSRAKGKE